jgi:histidine ammonia-lyase
LRDVLGRLRAQVPRIEEDRVLSPEIERAGGLVTSGELCDGLDLPELEGAA